MFSAFLNHPKSSSPRKQNWAGRSSKGSSDNEYIHVHALGGAHEVITDCSKKLNQSCLRTRQKTQEKVTIFSKPLPGAFFVLMVNNNSNNKFA